MSRILDRYLRVGHSIFFARAELKYYFSFRGVFQCVRHQVVENNGDYLPVKADGSAFCLYFCTYIHIRILIQFLVFESDFLNQLAQVVLRYFQLSVFGFGFAELQNLVDQVQQPVRAVPDDADFVQMFGRKRPVCKQILQRAKYQREGSAQFMRDVRIKTKPFVVQLLVYFVLVVFQAEAAFQRELAFVEAHNEVQYSCADNHVKQFCIPCEPERRTDGDFHRGEIFSPFLIEKPGLYFELVCSGRKVAENHLVFFSRFKPRFGESFHHIGIFSLRTQRIVHYIECHGNGVVVVRNFHAFVVGPFKDGLFQAFRFVSVAFDSGNLDFDAAVVVGQLFGSEVAYPVLRSEVNRAVFVFAYRTVHEICLRHSLLVSVVVETLLVGPP